MTNEERDAFDDLKCLQSELGSHGIHLMTDTLDDFGQENRDALRSLLRREERLRVMEAGVRAAEWLLEGVTCYPDDPMVKALNAATELLETEVPDGQG